MVCLLFFGYILCHYGDNVNVRYDDINTVINQTCWYEYPLEIQKHLFVIQMMAQRPISIRGFPNLEFDHPFFQKVTIFSSRVDEHHGLI